MAQPATVLILADVGDSERAALEAACTAAGFSPTVEPSAEAATQKLTAKRFDALVVHLGTPGAALACMRARGKLLRTRIPVLSLVDGDDEATFSRAYRAGADEVLLLDRPEWLTARLRVLPRSAIPQPGNARGDAVVADADRTRAEVVERVLRDAGFRVEVAVDGFSTRLQAGRPSLKVAVIDASLDDVPSLIVQAKAKGARCAWVVRARPEQLDELRQKLARIERVTVLSAYGPPDDVLFEINRLIEPRSADGRGEGRALQGSVLRLHWSDGGSDEIGYSYNWSATGLFVRTLAAPRGSKVTVEMTPPGATEKLALACEVVWRREFGATRKEPVPAGFALRITGGDVVAWTRVCPRTSSLPPANAAQADIVASRTDVGPRPPVPTRAAAGASARANGPVSKQSSGPAPTAPADVDVRARGPQSSVEAMLASVLKESSTDDEQPGAAPLSIDGGTVVELADPSAVASGFEDQVTAVHDAPKDLPALAPPYVAERARQEVLANALDASKTPLAIPRVVERPAPPRATSVIPRPSDASKSRTGGAPSAAEQKVSARAATPSPPANGSAPAPSAEIRRKSDRPPPETTGIDLSDITPASIGFDLSEDGRLIEDVRTLPPVAERRSDAAPRPSGRPSSARPVMQLPSRGGTLAGTGPTPFDLRVTDRSLEPSAAGATGPVPAPRAPAEPAEAVVPRRAPDPPSSRRRSAEGPPPTAKRPSDPPPAAKRPSDPPPAAKRPSDPPPAAKRPSDPPPAAKRPSDPPPAAKRPSDPPPGARRPSDPPPPSSSRRAPVPAQALSPSERPTTAPMANPPPIAAAESTRPDPLASTVLAGDAAAHRPVLGVRPPPPSTTRVVADTDAIPTGETVRPAAAGLPEQGPLPPLGAFRPAEFAAPRPDAPSPDSGDDYELPKRRSSLGMWIAVAAVLGGAAALFATPSLRKLSPAEQSAARPEAPPAPASALGLEKKTEMQRTAAPTDTAAPPETAKTMAPADTAAPPETTKAAPEQPPAASARPAATVATGASPSAAPAADDKGAEVDSAALAALPPGQGYLYVASHLSTNVYLYGNLAGTTNQRITTKCGPRFIRLGTELGKWQTEGLVQIVKCGALTRVEMGQ
jgi:DNA-binding response OmpR family regulator